MEPITGSILLTTSASALVALAIFRQGYFAWQKQKQQELISAECKKLYFLLSDLNEKVYTLMQSQNASANINSKLMILSEQLAEEKKYSRRSQAKSTTYGYGSSLTNCFQESSEQIKIEEKIDNLKKTPEFNLVKEKGKELSIHCKSIKHQFDLCSNYLIFSDPMEKNKNEILKILQSYDTFLPVENSLTESQLENIAKVKKELAVYIFFG